MIDPKLPLEARQKALEMEMRGLGILQYRRVLRKAREKQREGATQHGIVLIKRALDDVAEGIVGFLSEMGESQRGPWAGACPLLRRVDPRVAALIGLRVIIDGLIGGSPLAAMASKVGRRLEDEAKFQTFRRVAPTRFDKVKEEVRRASTYRHKRTVAVHRANKLGVEWPRFNQADRLRAGMVILETVEKRTGYIQFRLVRRHKHQQERIVVATPQLSRWVEKQTSRCEVLCPRYLPSYMEPRPWGTNGRGGYHYPQVIGDMFLVKTRWSEHRERVGCRLDSMPLVLEAVNALQATPWQVNRPVLEVAKTAWALSMPVEGLPPREDLPLPPRPHDIATNEEARKVWRREAFPVRDYNARSLARRLLVARTLWTAEQFAQEASFYFPHQLDFRGRAYPLVSGLSPQGGDMARGLLRFAKGLPIEDGDAAGWLAIHGANCWGFDTAPLDDRIAYVEAMNDEIEAIAADPFAMTSWTRADAPFQFLAFCFEWAEYLRTGYGFISHLPVAMDATCSGIQHFSAMLRDPVGAAATNLSPAAQKADIYQVVCDKLVERFTADLSNHAEPAWKGATWSTASAARGWLALKPDRTVTKQQVMTTPYGVTGRGMAHQTAAWLLERRHLLPWPASDCRRMAGFAASRLKAAVDETVVGAAEVMRWLRDVAKVMCRVSKPLYWRTPVGFPVFQHYLSSRKQAVRTVLGDIGVRVTYREEDGPHKDPTEMRNSIAPNFVHSMDAAHMMQTVHLSRLNGIADFAAIHDSFGTHAARTAEFAKLIREAFIWLYEDDILADFIRQLQAQLPEHLLAELPEPPPRGDFDIALVRDSEFFFS